jgi:hypothetical protein
MNSRRPMACVILLATALMNGVAVWIIASPGHRLQDTCLLIPHLLTCLVVSVVCTLVLRRHVGAIPVAVVVSCLASFCIVVGPAVVRGDLEPSSLFFWIRRSPAFRDMMIARLPMACGVAAGTWLWLSRRVDKQPNEQMHGTADVRP